ncbi:MAG: anhydro-N-acetylmuramic acid kinase [Gemmatimonadaceae bacterium]|nr:anhydro-N-acetylmuramic acid kinase [Gemmatimonadaceae bacterium]
MSGGRAEDHIKGRIEERVVVGLMSGTSLDGISAAAVRIRRADDARPTVELLGFVQTPYEPAQRQRLEQAMQQGSARDYCRLSADLGDWLGDAARAAMTAASLQPDDVHAIASHGQTLWHEPGHSTWQIGDAARIAERTGCAVVHDFRVRDMAVGGQGAPLVPMADRLLFSHEHEWRALQNIGGIGNVTLVPPLSESEDRVLAFDTGPGVVIIDAVVRQLFDQPFDRDSHIARRGRILEEVVRHYLDLPYLQIAPPKSTGRELFTPAFIADFVARCRAANASNADIVATATAYTAATIAAQYTQWLPTAPATVVVSGGGARNPLLMAALDGAFAWHHERFGRPIPAVHQFDALFFDAEAKEAVAFALLGFLHLTGRPGNVPSATGARAPRTLGAYTPVR